MTNNKTKKGLGLLPISNRIVYSRYKQQKGWREIVGESQDLTEEAIGVVFQYLQAQYENNKGTTAYETTYVNSPYICVMFKKEDYEKIKQKCQEKK